MSPDERLWARPNSTYALVIFDSHGTPVRALMRTRVDASF
jgi:hypothetical protein